MILNFQYNNIIQTLIKTRLIYSVTQKLKYKTTKI